MTRWWLRFWAKLFGPKRLQLAAAEHPRLACAVEGQNPQPSDAMSMGVVERNETPIHYWVGGPEDAPCVALIHGALLDHHAFDAQLDALLERYRVFIWDCPGHGQSQPIGRADTMSLLAADLWAALDAAEITEVAFVGHSAGGFVAQFAQRIAPERVWAMSLASTASVALPYSESAVLGMELAPSITRWFPWEGFVRLTARSVARGDGARALTRNAARAVGATGFAEIWKPIASALKLEGRPPSPPVPTLLLLGEDDRAGMLQSEMVRWAQASPGTALVTIPDAGHNVMQDNPTAFTAQLLWFLDAHRPSTTNVGSEPRALPAANRGGSSKALP